MELDNITREIASELVAGRTVDTRLWVSRFPKLAEEIVDTVIWLRGLLPSGGLQHLVDSPAVDLPPEAAVSASAVNYQSLAQELRTVREVVVRPRRGRQAPIQFKRAAVYAWTAKELSRGRPRVTRLATQKCVYLLEQALKLNLFTQHSPMKLGPYDRTAKYVDAEPIAVSKGWIELEGAEIQPGPNVSAVLDYAPRYLRVPHLAQSMLSILSESSDAELETIATIKAAADMLTQSGVPVSADAVRSHLATLRVWSPKLSKSNFSVTAVQQSLIKLSNLGLV